MRGLRALVFSLLACGVAGCRAAARPGDVSPVQIDTVWYATARERTDNHLSFSLADSLEYGYYRVATRSDVDPMRGDLDLRVIDSARLSGDAFLTAISKPSRDSNNVVVLSVHGYKTDHRKAIRDVGEASRRSGSKARWVTFSWPSTGRAFNWSPPGRFITGAYRDDSVAADKSRPAFVRLTTALQETVGGARLVVIAHSLGAQIVTESLARDSALRVRLDANPLRAVGLFEPDIPAQRFAAFSVPRLASITKRLVVYASKNDLMLQISGIVNQADRAGLARGELVSSNRLETIDATLGISAEGFFRRSFGTHHAMRRESGALRDFFGVVVSGAPKNCRVGRGTAEQVDDNVWRLLPFPANGVECVP